MSGAFRRWQGARPCAEGNASTAARPSLIGTRFANSGEMRLFGAINSEFLPGRIRRHTMYEAESKAVSGLAPETLRRMHEVFDRQVCSVCRAPAERLSGGAFFCPKHYAKGKASGRAPRVYRCSVAVEG